jgi:hypothetical protein
MTLPSLASLHVDSAAYERYIEKYICTAEGREETPWEHFSEYVKQRQIT